MIQGSTTSDDGSAKVSACSETIADPFAARKTESFFADENISHAVEACVACYHQCRECCYANLIRQACSNQAVERWLDCAALCMTCAMLIARRSELAAAATALCARACDRCVDELELLSDSRWDECAAACTKTAACCREFVATTEQS